MTERERSVMALCRGGLSQSEMAARLGLSNQTIARTCKALGIVPADGRADREAGPWEGVAEATAALLDRIARAHPERVAA